MAADANPFWTHPTLGRFEREDGAWVAVVSAPGFDAFAFDPGDAPPPPGDYEIAIYDPKGADEGDAPRAPSAAQAALAARVVAQHATLPAVVARALWDDLNGRGPGSPMWWHGNLDEVLYNMDDAPDRPLASAADVAALLSLGRIAIHASLDGAGPPVAELTFHAPFEEEHGVGVLTDGDRVLGIGYAGDPTPFDSE